MITLNTLSNHFANHTKVTPDIKHAEEVVGQKYGLIKTEVHDKFVFFCVKLNIFVDLKMVVVLAWTVLLQST